LLLSNNTLSKYLHTVQPDNCKMLLKKVVTWDYERNGDSNLTFYFFPDKITEKKAFLEKIYFPILSTVLTSFKINHKLVGSQKFVLFS